MQKLEEDLEWYKIRIHEQKLVLDSVMQDRDDLKGKLTKVTSETELEMMELRKVHEKEIKDQTERFQKFCEEIKQIYDEEKCSLTAKITQQKEKLDLLTEQRDS